MILAINMREFVAPESQGMFNSVRGSRGFANVLRDAVPETLKNSKIFKLSDVKMGINGHDAMTADEIGYMTGVFRRNMLDYYSAPDYQLQKSALSHYSSLRRNWQFKKLFEPVWKQWDIFIRPTMTGMFIIRLTRRYDKAAPILNIAHDVIKLQTAFDLHSAIDESHKLQANTYNYEPEELASKQRSVNELLEWLGVDAKNPPLLRYAPVQWQLATEVARAFVREIGDSFHLPEHNGDGHIKLTIPSPGDVQTVHDSHVIYHIDELLTTLSRYSPERDYSAQRTSRVVAPEDFVHSREVRQQVTNLLEGSMLRRETPNKPETASTRYFPIHSDAMVKRILDCNLGGWDDELCLLSSRTSIVMPSRRATGSELYISTLPTTGDASLMYPQYWDAMERMVEFVVEVHVLAQILERASENILQDFVVTLRRMREDMLNDYLHIDRHRGVLVSLIDESANLSRLVSVCQSMSNPEVWSRAEYGADKAEHLLKEMKLSVLLEHTERNVSSLTALVNQIDELYLAGLSEDNNRETFWLSLVLASLSLSIILFSLPSFWADVDQLNTTIVPPLIIDHVLPFLNAVGTAVAPVILVMSFLFAIAGLFRASRARNARHKNIKKNQTTSVRNQRM